MLILFSVEDFDVDDDEDDDENDDDEDDESDRCSRTSEKLKVVDRKPLRSKLIETSSNITSIPSLVHLISILLIETKSLL